MLSPERSHAAQAHSNRSVSPNPREGSPFPVRLRARGPCQDELPASSGRNESMRDQLLAVEGEAEAYSRTAYPERLKAPGER